MRFPIQGYCADIKQILTEYPSESIVQPQMAKIKKRPGRPKVLVALHPAALKWIDDEASKYGKARGHIIDELVFGKLPELKPE